MGMDFGLFGAFLPWNNHIFLIFLLVTNIHKYSNIHSFILLGRNDHVRRPLFPHRQWQHRPLFSAVLILWPKLCACNWALDMSCTRCRWFDRVATKTWTFLLFWAINCLYLIPRLLPKKDSLTARRRLLQIFTVSLTFLLFSAVIDFILIQWFYNQFHSR